MFSTLFLRHIVNANSFVSPFCLDLKKTNEKEQFLNICFVSSKGESSTASFYESSPFTAGFKHGELESGVREK